MLIKTGNFWVDPERVEVIRPGTNSGDCIVYTRDATAIALKGDADDAAAAVNKALKRYDTVFLPASPAGAELAPALTDLERNVLLDARKRGMRWIARDITGRLFAYERAPKKGDGIWNSGGAVLSLDGDLFGFLHEEDKAPTSIGRLLRLEMGKW